MFLFAMCSILVDPPKCKLVIQYTPRFPTIAARAPFPHHQKLGYKDEAVWPYCKLSVLGRATTIRNGEKV